MTAPAGLEEALAAFARRDVAAFAGLPEGTTLEQAAEVLGADPASFGQWRLGDPPQTAFFTPAQVEGHDQVRIWHRDGLVLKVQGDAPEMDPSAVDALGEPDERLDAQTGTGVVEGGERVYAGRGVAVQVNRSGTYVVSWSVFPPTTPARYRETLRAAPEHRERPAEA